MSQTTFPKSSDKCVYCKHMRACHVVKNGKQKCDPFLTLSGIWCGCQRFIEPDPRNRDDHGDQDWIPPEEGDLGN